MTDVVAPPAPENADRFAAEWPAPRNAHDVDGVLGGHVLGHHAEPGP